MEKKKAHSQCKLDLMPVGFRQFSIGRSTDGDIQSPFSHCREVWQPCLLRQLAHGEEGRALMEATPAQGSIGTTTPLRRGQR